MCIRDRFQRVRGRLEDPRGLFRRPRVALDARERPQRSSALVRALLAREPVPKDPAEPGEVTRLAEGRDARVSRPGVFRAYGEQALERATLGVLVSAVARAGDELEEQLRGLGRRGRREGRLERSIDERWLDLRATYRVERDRAEGGVHETH